MLQLFVILVAGGHVAGTWGPLPYGFDECMNRRAEFRAAIENAPEAKDWRISCEWHAARPELGASRE